MAFQGSATRLSELLTVVLTSPVHIPEPLSRECGLPLMWFLYYGEMGDRARRPGRLLRFPGLQTTTGATWEVVSYLY
jgi:hypothetical protein